MTDREVDAPPGIEWGPRRIEELEPVEVPETVPPPDDDTEIMAQEPQISLRNLGAVPALEGVSGAGREALARIAVPRKFFPDDEILAQGEETSSFFVLVSGRAKMARYLESGRTVILSLFGPSDLFGAVAALGGQMCDAAVIALEPTVCLEVRRDALFQLFGRQPQLIADLLPVLTRQLVECKNCIVELSCYRVEFRLAQVFIKLAETMGKPQNGGTFIGIDLSRQEVADLVGTTIETCIRIMSRWNKEGLLLTQDDGFFLPDRAALEAVTDA
jgi:CRP-like cAMP-binding protein